MVERAGACGALPDSFCDLELYGRALGYRGRFICDNCRILRCLRIHALVHAFAEEAEYRAVGDLFPIEWPSSSASSLHAQEFQRGVPVGGSHLGHAYASIEGKVRAGDWAVGAECTAEGFQETRAG